MTDHLWRYKAQSLSWDSLGHSASELPMEPIKASVASALQFTFSLCPVLPAQQVLLLRALSTKPAASKSLPQSLFPGKPNLSQHFQSISSSFFLFAYIYLTFKNLSRACLVAQWLRICLPMQGTRVQALVREDPTCRGATKAMCHNC